MKGACLSWFALLSLAACQTTPTTTRIEAPRAVEGSSGDKGALISGFVLVDAKHQPNIAPNSESWHPKRQAALDHNYSRYRATGYVRGEWVEVESVSGQQPTLADSNHCHQPPFWGHEYKLTLYAHRKTLIPVVRKSVDAVVSVDDLVRIKASKALRPGDGPNQYGVRAGNVVVQVTLPKTAVGLSYEVPTRLTTEGMLEDSVPYTLKDTAIQIGDSEIQIGRHGRRVEGPRDIKGLQEAPVVLQMECVAVRGKAPTSSMTPEPRFAGRGGGGFGRGGMGGPLVKLEKGTAIFWPDGRSAGTVRNSHKIVANFKKAPGGLLCPIQSPAGDYPICFKEGSVNKSP